MGLCRPCTLWPCLYSLFKKFCTFPNILVLYLQFYIFRYCCRCLLHSYKPIKQRQFYLWYIFEKFAFWMCVLVRIALATAQLGLSSVDATRPFFKSGLLSGGPHVTMERRCWKPHALVIGTCESQEREYNKKMLLKWTVGNEGREVSKVLAGVLCSSSFVLNQGKRQCQTASIFFYFLLRNAQSKHQTFFKIHFDNVTNRCLQEEN